MSFLSFDLFVCVGKVGSEPFPNKPTKVDVPESEKKNVLEVSLFISGGRVHKH